MHLFSETIFIASFRWTKSTWTHTQWEYYKKRQMLSLFLSQSSLCSSWAQEDENLKYIWKKKTKRVSKFIWLNWNWGIYIMAVLVRFLNKFHVPGQSGLMVQHSQDFERKKWFLSLQRLREQNPIFRKQISSNKGCLAWCNSSVCFGSLSAFSLLAQRSLFIDIIITTITNYWNEACITDFTPPTSALQTNTNQGQTIQDNRVVLDLSSFYHFAL